MKSLNQGGKIKTQVAFFLAFVFLAGLIKLASAQVAVTNSAGGVTSLDKAQPLNQTPVFVAVWTPIATPTFTAMGTLTPSNTPTKTATPNLTSTITFTPTFTNTPIFTGTPANVVIVQGTPLTSTPTPNYTTTPTPTPFSFTSSVDTSTSTAVTLAVAVPGYKINLRGLTIGNTNSTTTTAGSFYIDDGSVTIYGPVTLYGTVGVNLGIPYYAQGINRPLRFVNVNSVADMAGCVNYSIDLPGVK